MESDAIIDENSAKLIDRLVESGRFQSRKDVVREGLRLLEEREAERQDKINELRASIQEGIDSGHRPAEEVFARLREKYERMARERGQ